jgi:hypothetical protein
VRPGPGAALRRRQAGRPGQAPGHRPGGNPPRPDLRRQLWPAGRPGYRAPFRLTGTLHTVTVDLSGDLITDTDSEMRMAWPASNPVQTILPGRAAPYVHAPPECCSQRPAADSHTQPPGCHHCVRPSRRAGRQMTPPQTRSERPIHLGGQHIHAAPNTMFCAGRLPCQPGWNRRQIGGCARFASGRDQLHSVRRSISPTRSWCAQVSSVYCIRGRLSDENPTPRNFRYRCAASGMPGRR